MIEAVLLDPAYSLLVDQDGPIKVCHGECFHWSPSVARRFKTAFDEWFASLDEPAYVAQFTDGGKTFSTKFVRWLGFEPLAHHTYWGRPALFYIKVI